MNAWDWAASEVAWGHKGIDNSTPAGTSLPAGSSSSGSGGIITSPKFGTSHNHSGRRVVLSAGIASQVVSSSGYTLRVSIRNVGNSSVIFSESSDVSPTSYSSALQGASGAEPTAGESIVFETDSDIWSYSTNGTILIIDIESI